MPEGDYELIIYSNDEGDVFPWIRWLGAGEPTNSIKGISIDAVIRFSVSSEHKKLQIHCMFPNDYLLTNDDYKKYFGLIKELLEEYYGFQVWTAWLPGMPIKLCNRQAQVHRGKE